MTTRSAIPLLAGLARPACLSAGVSGLAIGVAMTEVAVAAADASSPPWIKIAPRGELRCRDGRTFTLEPEAVIARFSADATRVAIDVGHGTVTDHATPAIGWIEEMQARPDGLYGRPDWLASGKAVLAARTHRYVSPAFHHDDQNRATWLHSVALVAAPALSNMPAVASAQAPAQEPSMKSIATAVGLAAEAGETAILAAISTSFVKKDLHEELLAQLAATSTELKTLKDGMHKEAVDRALEEALNDQKIAPASREHLAKLSATSAGFQGVVAMLASIAKGTVAGPSSLDGKKADTGAVPEKSAATLAAEAAKYATDHGVSFVDAMSIITRPKAA